MVTVTINGVEYSPTVKSEMAQRRIVCVDNRGLLFVGDVDFHDVDSEGFCTIIKARCIIRWGTSGHIAELVETGPLPNTTLGAVANVQIRPENVQFSYIVKAGWGDGD